MPKRGQLYIISYDISKNRTRNKVADELKNYGRRVQYSVFECELTESKLNTLYEKLLKLCAKEGNVRFYRICENCMTKTRFIGTLPEAKDRETTIIV